MTTCKAPIGPDRIAGLALVLGLMRGCLRSIRLGLLWLVPTLALAANSPAPQARPLQRLTVQLSWTHQTEFAGFYMAQRARYFEEEGLDLVLLPGSAEENPLEVLRRGAADVAIATLRGALAFSKEGQTVTNIAQIHQSSPIVLMCRPSLGVASPSDIPGQKIGVTGGGDRQVLDALVRVLSPEGAGVTKVPRDGAGRVLIAGEAACITGVTFNELLRVEQAGIRASDLLVVRPEAHGVVDFGDGLYVRTDRLESPEFRAQLVGLLRALSKGWQDARKNPSLAVAQTLERNPALDRMFEHQALEQVLELVPSQNFGLLQLEQLEKFARSGVPGGTRAALPMHAWTHRIWNEWQQADRVAQAMTPATRHALFQVTQYPLFIALVDIGILMFALSGALMGIERGYNIWGRLLVATLPALGGGALRDLMIGGARLPQTFIADPSLPLAILGIVLLSSMLIALFPAWVKTPTFARIMLVASVTGSAVIATNGAVVALIADVPWIWVPVFAAISCSGGGLLLDIVSSVPPRSFRGGVLEAEERGVLSGLTLLLFLWVANQFERPDVLVYGGTLVAVGLNIMALGHREALAKYYPQWLLAGTDHTADR